MFLALLPFHFVSCSYNMSTFLRSVIFASSLPLPVIVPIFKVPTLISERLPFHASRCFFTRLPPLFLLLFSLCLAVDNFLRCPAVRHLRRLLVTRAATDPVWIDNDYAFACFGKKFYAGCLSCRNPPHLSGLGTGIKRHRNVPPMAGLKPHYQIEKLCVDRHKLFVNLKK